MHTMKDFMMIFRHTPSNEKDPTPEVLQDWQNWIGGIAAQLKFVNTHQLGSEGKILKSSHTVSDGPYAALEEVVGGSLVVKAGSMEEAVEMAKNCPILSMGGNVEVRNILMLNN